LSPHVAPFADDRPEPTASRQASGCRVVSHRVDGSYRVKRHGKRGKVCDHHGLSDDTGDRNGGGGLSTHQLDRNYAEILQEVRVAQTGVQVLLAFVLSLAFTPKFKDLTTSQHHLYVAMLVLGTLAASLLMAPAAFNRLVFRRALRRRLVAAANRFALAGLTFLLATIGCAIMLVLQVVLGPSRLAVVLTAAVVCWFAITWFAIPAWWRFRHHECGSD
jgi:Family of unknown function (DUF6328)